MGIIQVPQLRRKATAPLVAMVDLQKEYVAKGRASYVEGLEHCLTHCRTLLNVARELGLPIAHFRQADRGHYFNRLTHFSKWIDGFEPRANEHVYERHLPSCLSNDSFAKLISGVDEPRIIFAGLTGEQSLLTTAIDGFNRGWRSTFVIDCSATRVLGRLTPADAHFETFRIISLYAEVSMLEEILGPLRETAPYQWTN